MRKGKKRPFDIVVSDSLQSLAHGRTTRSYGYLAAFQSFGSTSPDVSSDEVSVLERFVCALYGRTGSRTVNKLRYDIFRSRYDSKKSSVVVQNGIDMSLLPPLHFLFQFTTDALFACCISSVSMETCP